MSHAPKHAHRRLETFDCRDNDSPWLVCKPCAAVGQCAKPAPLTAALDGLLASMGREPTEAELRAAAHALTVRADRLVAASRVMGFASGAKVPPDVTVK